LKTHKNDQHRPQFLRVSRFKSIKTKIIVFALLATIIPSLFLGMLSYLQSSELLRGRISHVLRNTGVQASGKLDLWLKERLYDLRVFSTSYLISENLSRITGQQQSDIDTLVAEGHIKAYLKSVKNKFNVYEELILISPSGQPLVTSAEASSNELFPDEWLAQLQTHPLIRGKSHFDPYVGQQSIFIAEGVKASDGRTLGILAAKIDLLAIGAILKRQTSSGIDEIYLINANGKVVVSSRPPVDQSTVDLKRATETNNTWPDSLQEPIEYVGYHGKAEVGMAVPIPAMDWVMVVEMDKEKAYAEIISLRRVTVLLVAGLMLCIGIFAYIFGHTLVRPVRRLSKGAARVAAGNLEVDIPVTGLSEVSYLTQVFNHMVASLRHGREELSAANNALRETNKELHQLSITDGLTSLYNRMHIMDLFDRELSRAKRHNRSLAALMLDIDYFKKINDSYGHQVGDNVMRLLAETLLASVRDCDFVGRYGGEEFLVILSESSVQGAVVTAERIRQNVSQLEFASGREKFSMTVSIGVAEYPGDGDDAQSILNKADDALYQAKANGRNRVAVSENESTKGSAKVHVLPVKNLP